MDDSMALSLLFTDDSLVDEDPVLSLSQNMDGAVDDSSGALSLLMLLEFGSVQFRPLFG